MKPYEWFKDKCLKNLFAWAAIATVVYVGLVTTSIGWQRLFEFWGKTDTAPNAIGDFLAGIFAPIAVIWLVFAVYMQRQELNEARTQAEAAQTQFSENQKVVAAQLATIHTLNDSLVQQNQQALENAKQAYRLSLFDKRMQIYQKFVDFGDARDGVYTDDDYWTITNLAHEAAFVFDQSIEEWLHEIAELIHDYLKHQEQEPLVSSILPDGTVLAETPLSRKDYIAYMDMITLQFLPENRSKKFRRFMRVSDQPYSP